MGELKNNTKAATLAKLKDEIKKSYIEDFFVIRVNEFLNDSKAVCEKVLSVFGKDTVVVRSSLSEGEHAYVSEVVEHKSVLDIKANDSKQVAEAIQSIIDSYASNNISNEEIMIQRQTKNIRISGLVCNRDIIYNRPYYMVTYDVKSNSDLLSNVWNGRTTWISKNASREFLGDSLVGLVAAVKEIEKILDTDEAFSIEFGIDKNNKVVIIKISLIDDIMAEVKPMSDREFIDTKAFAKCNYLDTNHIMSDMAYLNVVKTLGVNPRHLDYSLYRDLITSRIWNEALLDLGYEAVPDELMFKIGNKPYISVNNVFLGLTPRGLGSQLTYKLIEYYSYKLRGNKALHGKVEDNVFFTSYNFATKDSLGRLIAYDFGDDELNSIEGALYNLTVDVVNNYSEWIKTEKEAVGELGKIREAVASDGNLFEETNVMKLYKYISDLVEILKSNGAPQYVRQKRCDFIARSFLDSLVKRKYFTSEEINEFLDSIENVETGFEKDFDKFENGQMSIEEFSNLYGGLRLESFDIRKDCLRDFYTGSSKEKNEKESDKKGDKCTNNKLDKETIKRALATEGIEVDSETFLNFIVDSIVNKAYFEFEFKKAISLLLDIIIQMGDVLGIAREDMSYLEIQDLLSYHSRDSYIQIIESRRNMYHANRYLMLPEVIFGVGDIDVIDYSRVKPYYVTEKSVIADVVCLDDDINQDISGKIVALSNIKSEYNWLFEKNVAGIVSKYGDTNLKIAARCKKYGVPAVFGCGEKIYQHIIAMERVELDCQNGKIREFLN